MRIAVVHSFYASAQPSGENTVVLDQVALLEEAGHEVLLVAEHTDERSRDPANAPRSAARVATGVGRSPAERLGRFRPDVVHVHNTFPNFGTRWVRAWGSRTVVTLHNFRTVCSNGLLFRDGQPCTDCLTTPVLPAVRHGCYRGSPAATLPLALASAPGGSLRRLPRDAARVVALTPEAARIFGRVAGRDVDVVPNFAAAAASSERSTGRWAYVGRLGVEKGIAELMRDWPSGQALDVIGDGPLRDVVEERSARDPGVRPLGSWPRERVLARLGDYRGLVLPSVCAEGMPTVVLEALARSVPLVVSSHVHAAASLVEAGAAAAYTPAAGRHALVEAVARVEATPGMGEAARRLHGERYSPEAWLASMSEIYGAVAAGAHDR